HPFCGAFLVFWGFKFLSMDTGWHGNQRQAKMLSARFRCIFWDNGWFGGTGNALQSDLAENTGTR
ncbi:hypothetical protein, partial [Escherichia coli]|uniref:hypothetical protein n=1 Tax=Escherichia coli TaxID=562 RepID=UPI001A9C5E28